LWVWRTPADATVVSKPGKTRSQWRIDCSLRLPTQECDCFVLASTIGAVAAERFAQFKYQAGDLVLADAGYSHPPGIQSLVEQNAAVCVRLNPYAMPMSMEELRTQTEYQPANDSLGLPCTAAQKIVNRILAIMGVNLRVKPPKTT
jgi:hypothetical protein